MKNLKSLAFNIAVSSVLISGVAFAAPEAGKWVVEQSPEMPGFTRIIINEKNGVYNGIVTSAWYGDLPMKDIQIDGERINFHLFNGNMRVPEYPIQITNVNGKIRMKGRIWDSEFDITGNKATDAQIRALDFPVEKLPPHRVVKQVPLAKTPPMGWSSWNKFAEHIDDKTIREIADALVSSGLRDAGYIYVNIDDGWQGKRDKNGNLMPNDKFPDMKGLVDYVHSKGLKIGIYSSPGPKTCAGYEGSYAHVEQDAQSFADWGFDYLKYDLCSGEAFYNNADTVYRTYQQMGEALQATGRDIMYSLCQYGRFNVGLWGRDVGGHLWRTTGDIEDNYAVMARIGFDANGVPNHSGPNGWNDPDMLEVGNGGMSVDEYKTHMSLWAILSAPLILGNDVRSMDAQTLEMLKNREIIAINQDKDGVQALPIHKNGTQEIWSKKLSDGSVVIALFNRGEDAVDFSGKWSDIKLKPSKIRDLWQHKNLKADDKYSFNIPKHGVVLLKIK